MTEIPAAGLAEARRAFASLDNPEARCARPFRSTRDGSLHMCGRPEGHGDAAPCCRVVGSGADAVLHEAT